MKNETALLIALALLISSIVSLPLTVQADTGAEMALGLGLVTDVTGSTSATETDNGRAKVDTTAVAVLLNGEEIVDVKIDVVQPYTFFDTAGMIVETQDFLTKRELGDAYGMRAASSIDKEWHDQAAALEAFWIGKTVSEALAMEVDEEIRPAEEDLTASVTIHVDTYLEALEKAAASTVPASGEKVGLGIMAHNKRSAHATDDAEGLSQAYLHIAAVAVSADDLITAAIVDGLQANINIDAAGQITSDIEAEVKSKNELGDDYNMRVASEIDAEWYEQAAAFAAYLVDKTATEIEALSVENGKATDQDLVASVTITVTDMQSAALKAYNDALGEEAVDAEAVKTGLGIVTDITGSTSAEADADGRAKVDSTVVGVMLDANNIVRDANIDVIQAYTTWNAEGDVSEPQTYLSKVELGDDYNMRRASEIGAEWFEQAAALEEYWIGKSVDEVLAMELTDNNKTTDEDLLASVTIGVDAYLMAFEEAVSKATESGAQSTDKLALSIVADNNRSTAATDDAEGMAEAYIHYGLFTFNSEEVITSATIDALQARVNFDTTGQITSELVDDVTTKVELADDYGMVGASEIGKERYEQVDAFEAFIVGKTAEDLNALTDEEGKVTDEDLIASVTISVSAFQALVDEAKLTVFAPLEQEEPEETDTEPEETEEESQDPVETEEEPAPTETGVKTGLAVLTDVSGSTSADGDVEGRAKVDITVVAVLVADDGTIQDVVIDVVQPYTNFDSEGVIVEKKAFMTKRELGFEYGMLNASEIEKEWFEQARAFEDFVRGKTLDEVLSMELDAESRPAEADLSASVTIHVDAYLKALEEAVQNAAVLGANAADTLGLGIVAVNERSKDAADETNGQTEAYVHYAAASFDADGVLTSVLLDASQAKVDFDAEGQIITDLNVEQQTKLALGADYGMARASEIGKEWFEQSEALSTFVVGKDIEDILALAGEDGEVADEDLRASVTITIDVMLETIVKARQDAMLVVE